MSYLWQVDETLMVKTLVKSHLERPRVLFSEVLHLQCIIYMLVDEDHCSCLGSFIHFIERLNGCFQLLCSEVELDILDLL